MENNGLQVWEKVVKTSLSVPGVSVDRADYLQKAFSSVCSKEQLERIVETSPLELFDVKFVDQIADDCISYERFKTTALAAAAGLPGGWGLAMSVPADVVQYYSHILITTQKLLYLYGWPELRSEDGKLDDSVIHIVTLAVGVMLGVSGASGAINKLSVEFAKNMTKQLQKTPLTKYVAYNIIKSIGAKIGVKITKESFAKGVAKFVPIAGAAINGSITYIAFGNMSNKLKTELSKKSKIRLNNANLY